MSEMYVVVRPELLPGFQLAGVSAHPAEDVESAEELIQGWLDKDQGGLVAIDDGLLERMDTGILRRLRRSNSLFHIAIPGGEPPGEAYTRQERLADMVWRAIGFHITFEGIKEIVES
ncbi:MAG: V-type ATP synthase subunit F [Anaerolineales bacterium]|jgi:vacuolar-type H+-ATPase subunit F/Vma7